MSESGRSSDAAARGLQLQPRQPALEQQQQQPWRACSSHVRVHLSKLGWVVQPQGPHMLRWYDGACCCVCSHTSVGLPIYEPCSCCRSCPDPPAVLLLLCLLLSCQQQGVQCVVLLRTGYVDRQMACELSDAAADGTVCQTPVCRPGGFVARWPPAYPSCSCLCLVSFAYCYPEQQRLFAAGCCS